MVDKAGIFFFVLPANEKQCYFVTPSLIGWVHTQNNPQCYPTRPWLELTHLPLDKMAAILQMIFWDAFSLIKHMNSD